MRSKLAGSQKNAVLDGNHAEPKTLKRVRQEGINKAEELTSLAVAFVASARVALEVSRGLLPPVLCIADVVWIPSAREEKLGISAAGRPTT